MVPRIEEIKIGVVGLGYVGLPLAVAFGQSRFVPIIGFDVSEKRVSSLKEGKDLNDDVPAAEVTASKVIFTTDATRLRETNFIIVAVPTPVTKANVPDLSLIESASRIVGQHLQKNSVVVFESTVYPGVTEDVCVPIIQKTSGLKCGVDWFVGYSPERINPGDHEHTLEKITKVVSGMDAQTLEIVASVYGEVCKAGIYKAANIKTAEAAKVIENIQRDLNIALVNELSLIFERLGIETREVIEAAGTKWNFHKYFPGLVGGHCIGVDPFYLTYRAQEMGYNPEVILAGRRINDRMPAHVAELMVRGLVEAGKVVQGARVLVLGLTFKEDIKDTRNSKISETVKKLSEYQIKVCAFDPNLSREQGEKFGVEWIESLEKLEPVDGVILATLHREFRAMKLEQVLALIKNSSPRVLVDIKSFFSREVKSLGKGLIYKAL